ncbi:MAG: hypothetical protein JXQ71_06900, partial [Verrucomicrobia bacterium]|nr:hypothetical protein [Verrucomicrobiota bacterium]
LTSNRQAPDDGFYTPVAYKGAFEATDLWIDKWTLLAANGFLGSAAAPDPVILTISRSGSDAVISFLSQAGYRYRLLSATSLTSPIAWSDGEELAGNGTVQSFTVASPGPVRFFRVVAY